MVTVGVIIVTIKGLLNLFAEKYSVYLQKSLPSGYQWHKEAAAGLCFFFCSSSVDNMGLAKLMNLNFH